jgi:tetratricopeptide (TPR) repeat protein
LKWKYLGDELALRFRGSQDGERQIHGMDLMREASLSAHEGRSEAAEEKYRQAADFLTTSAAPSYHLARLQVEKERIIEGREIYQRALALDDSYRRVFYGAGLQYQWDGQYKKAEQEHLELLRLDPDNAEAHYGLALLAKRRRRWAEAEALLSRTVELERNFLDGYRALGDVLTRQGRKPEAIKAYKYALKLALDGYKPLDGAIITCPEGDRHMKDPWHFDTYARLARLYHLQGAFCDAIALYRMSIAGGNDGPGVRYQLAWLRLRQAHWRDAFQELRNTAKAIPRASRKSLRRFSRRLQLIFGIY